jgi:NADH-ubiquinone oxidoreductase chain 1
MVSYEVRIIFVIIIIFFLSKGFKIRRLVVYNLFNLSLVYGMLVIFLVWVVVILAELNRAPFDFAEGESELVSGFNVEYGGEKFAFYFLAEYGVIIFIIYLTILIFMGSINFLILGIFLILWVRGCFPRFRYDNLMYLA